MVGTNQSEHNRFVRNFACNTISSTSNKWQKRLWHKFWRVDWNQNNTGLKKAFNMDAVFRIETKLTLFVVNFSTPDLRIVYTLWQDFYLENLRFMAGKIDPYLWWLDNCHLHGSPCDYVITLLIFDESFHCNFHIKDGDENNGRTEGNKNKVCVSSVADKLDLLRWTEMFVSVRVNNNTCKLKYFVPWRRSLCYFINCSQDHHHSFRYPTNLFSGIVTRKSIFGICPSCGWIQTRVPCQ